MKLWNPKIQRVSSISWGGRAVGYRYRITYTMRKKTSEFLAEIVESRKPENLVIRLTEGHLSSGSYTDETYRLSRTAEGTLLEQKIEIHNSGNQGRTRGCSRSSKRFGEQRSPSLVDPGKDRL